MSFPVFASGDVLNALDMNAVGLWLVKTQTVGTGVSSVTVTEAFSADYDNYFVSYDGATTASGECLQFRLGSTTTGYYGNLIYSNYASGTVLSVGDNNLGQFRHCSGGDGTSTSLNIWVNSPFATRRTYVFTTSYEDTANAGNYRGYLLNTNSYTAFTLLVASGNITGGTIRVYGYRN